MPVPARPRVVAGLRLLSQVGEGGEGEVWEARDAAGRRRALKLIRPDALVPPDDVERRGRWLIAIDHPALVAVHRCGVLSGGGLDGWGFVEMSYVEGVPLEDAPANADALERLEPLAEALDLLHAGAWSDGVPLVHRDVKPANLIESEDGALVLVDASTLRDVDDGTRTRIGTPLYAAPEVVTGRAGPLADVYSFAATAVALLTGARRRELADLLADPDELDLPDGLRAALAPDPGDRPVSCRAALDPRLPLIVGAEVGWHRPEVDGAQDAAAAPQGADPGTWDARGGDEHGAAADGGSADAQDWLPSATEVLLDPWRDPWADGPDPGSRPSPAVWVWLVLAALLGGASLAGAIVLGWPERGMALAAVGGAHLLACLAARRGLLTSVLLPPLAWAGLLGDRAAVTPHARAWARSALLPGTVALGVPAAVLALDPGGPLDPFTAATLTVLGFTATVAVVASAPGGRLVRAALLPLWAVGAAVLVAGGVLLWPAALLARRGLDVRRGIADVLRGAAAFVRP